MNKELLILFLSAKQPRRIKLIENLLSGKRTVSTLFWAMRYNILQYSGVLRRVHFNDYHKDLNSLLNNKYIKKVDDYRYLLTDKGQKQKDSMLESFYIIKNNSFRYDYDVSLFKERFLLATQVVSEYSYKNTNYYPTKTNMQSSYIVKKWFIKNKKDISVRFRDYLVKYLSQISDDKANILAQLLIGHDVLGMTARQMAKHINRSTLEEFFIESDLWINLIQYIENDNNDFLKPLLKNIVNEKINSHAIETYKLFARNNSLKSISNMLHVKISTVKEHLIECAIWMPKDNFPYKKILTKNMIELMNDTFENKNIDDWKFNDLPKTNGMDFFNFRIYQIMRSK
ncbi:helix-turn-helix domain-containing protein [Apilactobacillus bombintestini]|uniref:Helicase Helix-turn-helix domain-containing protein n=1 Tax=Apilactobacillus bombintestini TaxID=2419772 RepID=A0A387APD2_9LACO|nr:helix-turn-helix domain-containing protein [Apilactobacillus bombintestini]AYF92552.1 hypothetical protein D7I45_03220 [Apilactobacillus bombintestini]